MKSASLAIVLTASAIATMTACTTSPQVAGKAEGDVPSITQPHLSLTPYSGKPCRVFGVDQLNSFGVSKPGTPDGDQANARCSWRSDRATTIGITLFGSTQGLGIVYATRGRFTYFQPTEVADYPAVDRDAALATTGTCATVVGIADNAAFEVQVDVDDEKSSDYQAPCAVSKQVAAVAVGNLQGGG